MASEEISYLVDDLLRGLNDWRGIPEIVRLSFKKLSEQVKKQGYMLRDLESTQVTRKDLQSQLSQKADSLQVSQQIYDLRAHFDRRSSYNEEFFSTQPQEMLKLSGELSSLQELLRQSEDKLMRLISWKADTEDLQRVSHTVDLLTEEKNEIAHVLSSKANYVDFEAIHSKFADLREENSKNFRHAAEETNMLISSVCKEVEVVRGQCTQKADAKEIDRVMSALNRKVETNHLNERLQLLNTDNKQTLTLKINEIKHNINFQEEVFNKKIAELLQNIAELEQAHVHALNYAQEINQKVDVNAEHSQKQTDKVKDHLLTSIDSSFQLANDQILKNKSMIDELFKLTAKHEDLASASARLNQRIDLKADAISLEKATSQGSQDLATATQEVRDEFRTKLGRLEIDIHSKIDQRVTASDLHTYLSEKADTGQMTRLISTKASVEDLQTAKREISKLNRDVQDRVLTEEFGKHVECTKGALEAVAKDMVLKANITDTCAFLDSKANIEDVNTILNGIHTELDLKSNKEDVQEQEKRQLFVNQVLCKEITIGRWFWQSGELRGGFYVPWESEGTNTASDVFLWESASTHVIVAAPGFYRVEFGFYGRKKPTAQLLINGDPIMSAVSNGNIMVHHSPSKFKQSAGNVGVTLVEHLMVSANTKISVSLTGDTANQGFLGLKKLS